MVPESRKIAMLLLENPTQAQWNHALIVENILQKSRATAIRQSRLIRNRLKTFDREGLELISGKEIEITRQLLLAASMRHSQLLADFFRDVYLYDLKRMERVLKVSQWDAFLTDCLRRDEQVSLWTSLTRKKALQVIIRILSEAKYLDNTKEMSLTPVLLHPKVVAYLKAIGDDTILSLLECT